MRPPEGRGKHRNPAGAEQSPFSAALNCSEGESEVNNFFFLVVEGHITSRKIYALLILGTYR